MFVLVVVLLLTPMVRRRRGSGSDLTADDRTEVPDEIATRWIVGLGVLMPAVVLIGVLALSVVTIRDISRPAPAEALRIDVEGLQFWWEARYPVADVTVANEIHIPVGEPVELTLTSADVIHSFWVPELNGKLDMLPDGPNTLVLEADEPGEYLGACAEFCGLQHANMGFLVIAQPREEFDAWLSAQAQPVEAGSRADPMVAEGRGVFEVRGCASCHVVEGEGVAGDADRQRGPDLTHVASRRTLAADTIPNTPEDLAEWLRDPDAVKPGTTMPDPQLRDEEVAALVAYLGSLR